MQLENSFRQDPLWLRVRRIEGTNVETIRLVLVLSTSMV